MGEAIEKREGRGELVGTFAAPADVNNRMGWAMKNAHLVSPATAVGKMPEGCGVAISQLFVDVENDTYDVGMGKVGLSKTVLQKIGGALGVSWDPIASGRLDDGSDPHYCHWRAVGGYRAFDGQFQTLVAEKEMDLREGSAQVEALWQRYEAKKRNNSSAKSPEGQIREMRLHILSHAETKAQLRAIRSLGVRTSYSKAELQKPFVAARIMFTGETSDPELKREFARMTADSFLSGTRSLYGRAPTTPGATPTPAPARLGAPPPVGSVPVAEDDAFGEPESVVDAEGTAEGKY